MATYDAQSQNTARGTRQYVDLDLFFGKKTSASIVIIAPVGDGEAAGIYDKEFGSAES